MIWLAGSDFSIFFYYEHDNIFIIRYRDYNDIYEKTREKLLADQTLSYIDVDTILEFLKEQREAMEYRIRRLRYLDD